MTATTLETVERLARQLSTQDQQALADRLHAKANRAPLESAVVERRTDNVMTERQQLVRELLAETADIEDDSQGTTDSVEAIRKLRQGKSE